MHVSFVIARKILLWTKCLDFIYMYTVILNENKIDECFHRYILLIKNKLAK